MRCEGNTMEVGSKNKEKFFYGWVIVIVGLIDMAMLIGSRQSYGVFFKSIESEFGLNRMATSGIFSVFMAFSGVFAFLGGLALDKFGPKWTLATMGFFTGLSLLVTNQMHSVWQLYLTYSFIMAIGTGETYTVVMSSVSRWFHKKRGLALGISSAGGGVGPLIIAPLATYLIINFNWHTAFIVLGVIALVVVVSLSMLLKTYPSDIGLLPDGVKPDITNDIVEDKKDARLAGLSLSESLRTRQFWSIFFVWMFQGAAVYIITTHIVPHATDLGFSPTAAAITLSAFGAGGIVGRIILGGVADWLGNKRAFVISLIVNAVAFLLLVKANQLWSLYLVSGILGLAQGGLGVSQPPLTADLFGIKAHALIMGVVGIGVTIGATIGPVLSGYMFDTTGNYRLAFLVSALIGVAGVVLAVMLNPLSQKERPLSQRIML